MNLIAFTCRNLSFSTWNFFLKEGSFGNNTIERAFLKYNALKIASLAIPVSIVH